MHAKSVERNIRNVNPSAEKYLLPPKLLELERGVILIHEADLHLAALGF